MCQPSLRSAVFTLLAESPLAETPHAFTQTASVRRSCVGASPIRLSREERHQSGMGVDRTHRRSSTDDGSFDAHALQQGRFHEMRRARTPLTELTPSAAVLR